MRVIPFQRRPVTRLSAVSGQDDLLLHRDADQRKRALRRRPRPPEQLHHARIGAAIHHDGLPGRDDRKEGMAEQSEQALLVGLVQPSGTPDHNKDWPLAAQPKPGDSRRHIRELTRPGDSSGVTVAELKQSHIHRHASSRDTRYEQGRNFPPGNSINLPVPIPARASVCRSPVGLGHSLQPRLPTLPAESADVTGVAPGAKLQALLCVIEDDAPADRVTRSMGHHRDHGNCSEKHL